MSDYRALLAACLLMPFVSCRVPSSPGSGGAVSHFRFDPEAFDSFFGVSRAHYSLSKPSHTSLFITKQTDGGGRIVVMTLFENLFETRGAHQHTWLGDTKEGTFAPSGIYIGILEAGSERFEAVVRVYHR